MSGGDWRLAMLLPALLMLSGCVTPWNTRLPNCFPGSLEYERREAQITDPFPDTEYGPGESMRPRDYDQRSEATRAKEKSAAAALRRQFGVPGAPPAPGFGLVYPEAVRE